VVSDLMYLCYNTPPQSRATMNVETELKIQKHQSGQTLREDVCELSGRRDMHDADITNGNAFLNEVEVNLDMLHMLVLNGVGREVDNAEIVVVDKSAL
jgi:hypothetical protein